MIEITNVHGVVIHPDRIEGTATFTTATGRLGSVDLATMEVQLAPPPDDR
ncbi:MAG: hypothetical protein HC893_08890 [Chloroflexaceae bacterium]|nr:hypothetical protein [Chloroflexaceae bacterium]